ncbi:MULTISPECIES: diacylglycerol kinase [Micromonospora]|uniref:Diacylglycerol kinase n=1 Tax=Micromonospora sicca TaxID=2202420 RepID=A0A317DDA8_9ACTN|nr:MULTISPECIES: diacylglycerol kinase [unclassified Micromonospora]MBM0225100.1 diacylglycerol kinase [Micromonospora sp. ATA51]MDZ5441702.1 diacylglycerol kinase [Micromonospora sp. 4G57]MDZ5490263.1 diacylglycerol kinase [Micromonospora sp. 4G53]PWR12282.1 diacylglycerol kinase [Micromonospora sp. 4G51]
MLAVTAHDLVPPGPVAVLANPTAGRGRHRGLLPRLLERLNAGGRPVRVLTAGTPAEAEAACHAAVADGAGALVAVGGDGTVHRALQAVAGTAVPFGPVPAGTGNDFAVDTGFPADPLAAVDVIAAALRDGRTRPVDLARMTAPDGGHRWYGAVLAAGFDAIVNERANRMRWPRGPRRYDLAILVELARLRPRRYTLRLDGEELTPDAVLVAVGNCPTYGGGMRICPDADPTDGLLDVVVGGRFDRRTLMRVKPRIYQGTHVDHPLVRSYRARTVELNAEGITTYADGERALDLPVRISAVPQAVRLLG